MTTLELVDTPVTDLQRQAFDRLLSPGGGRIFAVGRTRYSEGLARIVNVEAFVDDYTKDKLFLERPIIKMESLPKDCTVVSCVVDGRPITVLDRLRSCDVKCVWDYCTLLRLSPELFEPLTYCDGSRDDISGNLSTYQWVYAHLADDESRRTFRKVVQFRYSYDLDWLRGFTWCPEHQYFEDFIELGLDEVFVDGGGYDGQTSLSFASQVNDYSQIYYFEPCEEMMQISRKKLGQLKRTEFIRKGLFSREGGTSFDATAGTASRISESGTTEIQLTTLDREVSAPVSFIKLDVEGAEFDAINGSVNHIQSETPRIAICVYHNQSDFWRIPKRIFEMNDSYTIYVRHYSEGIVETVMYFVPKAR